MTIAEKRIEWETRIKEWQENGLSAAQWCKELNLNIHLRVIKMTKIKLYYPSCNKEVIIMSK